MTELTNQDFKQLKTTAINETAKFLCIETQFKSNGELLDDIKKKNPKLFKTLSEFLIAYHDYLEVTDFMDKWSLYFDQKKEKIYNKKLDSLIETRNKTRDSLIVALKK